MGRVVETIAELTALIQVKRAQGGTIVSTNGVFDLLHVGHVRYLRAARDLGDVLVVGVNADTTARRLKGPSRPFVNQRERAEVLAGLGSVDYVIVFDEDTPCELLAAIRPDIHVKGGDYDVEDLPEASTVARFGGRIVTLPFTEGQSTTQLAGRVAASAGTGADD